MAVRWVRYAMWFVPGEFLLCALVFSGCATYYQSTYWKHPVTGVIVECDLSASDAVAANDITAARRTYCESLMQRAGLVQLSREDGKAWEAAQR